MPNCPLDVHETAFFARPEPVSVSMATLNIWCDRHPPGYLNLDAPDLAVCMYNAVAWLEYEVPDCSHGLLVSGVRWGNGAVPEKPVVSTLRAYATRHADLTTHVLDAFGTVDQHILLLPGRFKRGGPPRWVWTSLASSMLIGDPNRNT